jgi:tetratricopeptide (TPR) repeat protein
MKYSLVLIILFISFVANAQDDRKDVNKGNKEYKKTNYYDAELWYKRALEKDSLSYNANYNLANVMYKTEKYEQAREMYNKLTNKTTDTSMLANLHYNVGNTLLKEKKYEESIEAYKKSLKILPNDYDAKSNLAYAKAMLPKDNQEGGNNNQDQQNQQDNNKQEQQNQQDKQNQQDQQNQEDKQENKQNKDQQNSQDQQDKQEDQDAKMTTQQANQILEAMRNNERQTQEKVQKNKEERIKTNQAEKNW